MVQLQHSHTNLVLSKDAAAKALTLIELCYLAVRRWIKRLALAILATFSSLHRRMYTKESLSFPIWKANATSMSHCTVATMSMGNHLFKCKLDKLTAGLQALTIILCITKSTTKSAEGKSLTRRGSAWRSELCQSQFHTHSHTPSKSSRQCPRRSRCQ